jgi:hypothetical protein
MSGPWLTAYPRLSKLIGDHGPIVSDRTSRTTRNAQRRQRRPHSTPGRSPTRPVRWRSAARSWAPGSRQRRAKTGATTPSQRPKARKRRWYYCPRQYQPRLPFSSTMRRPTCLEVWRPLHTHDLVVRDRRNQAGRPWPSPLIAGSSSSRWRRSTKLQVTADS